MDQVFEWLMCSDPSLDSHRFMDAIQAAIDAGDVQKHKRFSTWAKQLQLAKQADAFSNQASRHGFTLTLSAWEPSRHVFLLYMQRAKQADAFFDQLAEKYSSKPGGSKKRKARQEPTEEEWAALQQRLGLRKEGQAEGSQGKGKGGKKGSPAKHAAESKAKKCVQGPEAEGASGKHDASKGKREGGSKRRREGAASE
ncbi:hypothetical protein DUNSADRAFT_2046 [Dunaliella salina]|uniref:DNAJC9 HTH domain-containing protein n=1 Tax=Dunaliella salina TaxID=3046 RepID=A0ABQ7GW90_DUNSA|nr:hypothetical protein DUNSADRAFT_2046 [Dunaliella salina]|eukprot:KAF5838877.1 hypothetical protein DUNSADRAFT_2046 [Dunaliella salina]